MMLMSDHDTPEETTNSNDDSECIICMEKCEKKQLCDCVNIHMHRHCQRTLLESRQWNTHCTVCTSPYRNVSRTAVWRLNSVGICLVQFCIVILFGDLLLIVFCVVWSRVRTVLVVISINMVFLYIFIATTLIARSGPPCTRKVVWNLL